jgi:dienelactone hydrolase
LANEHAPGHTRARAALAPALALCLACSTTAYSPGTGARPPVPEPEPLLQHTGVPPEQFKVDPEPITVIDAWILHLYTFFHRRDYRTYRVVYPGHMGGDAIAHLLIPPGPGPHPTVIVFPILDHGSLVVSEAAAKALVRRGYLVAWLERPDVGFEQSDRAELPTEALSSAVRDARRLLDFLVTRDDVDAGRIATAGVSLGAMQACLLQAVDKRVRAGFYAMGGGGVAELLYDSTEVPVRSFRDNVVRTAQLETRSDFVAYMRPITRAIDPALRAPAVPPERVLMANGRFDSVIPRARADQMWEALGRPKRIMLPIGHNQVLPFFWKLMARGADHFDEV